jgi:hypothetical protein
MSKGKVRYKLKQHIKAQVINTAKYLNTKYKEDQCVDIFKSRKTNQPTKDELNR